MSTGGNGSAEFSKLGAQIVRPFVAEACESRDDLGGVDNSGGLGVKSWPGGVRGIFGAATGGTASASSKSSRSVTILSVIGRGLRILGTRLSFGSGSSTSLIYRRNVYHIESSTQIAELFHMFIHKNNPSLSRRISSSSGSPAIAAAERMLAKVGWMVCHGV
jgi:hypothetical protein